MVSKLLTLCFCLLISYARSFFLPAVDRHACSSASLLSMADIDPNFEANLPQLLKRGMSSDRTNPDLASELRARYKKIEEVKRSAAKKMRSNNNIELAIELEELADELAETHERFVDLSVSWDAWNRPDPATPQVLRTLAESGKGIKSDPNFIANLPKMMGQGLSDNRMSPDLPSELRMLKYKNKAATSRIAAKELKDKDSKLADELEDIADEIEMSHRKFEEMAANIKERMKMQDNSVSKR